MSVVLLGVPTDINSSFVRGTAKAPKFVREKLFSLGGNLTAECGLDLSDPGALIDLGDLSLHETPDDHDTIARAARDATLKGAPLFIGGDHSITYPLLKGVVEARGEPVNVVHIDAHPDLYPDFEGNRMSHASPFARILEAGLATDLHQLGIRAMTAVQQEQADRHAVTVVRPISAALEAWKPPAGATYLTIDLDGLDPAYAPGVSHPEPGGLSTRQLLEIIERLPGPVIGADIVEYNPDRDLNDLTAAVCAKLIKAVSARLLKDQQTMSG